MTSFPVLRTVAFVSSAAALFALSYGGIAHAITDSIFQYTNPKKGYFSLSPSALAPQNSSYADTFAISTPVNVHPTPGNAACLVGGVNLPDNAQMTEIASWVSSDLASGAEITLYRSNPATGDASALASQASSDTTQTRQALTQTLSATAATKVANHHFNYSVVVCLFSGNSLFYGARIAYTYTDAGD